MSAKVDVLAVMRDGASDYDESGHDGLADDMREARTAVAELIVQARIADDLLAHEGFRADDVPRCDLRAALARVTPEPKP